MTLDDYVRLNRLFDLYSGLLTDKQKVIAELHILEDLSFSEISEQLHISKQAVGDAIITVKTKLEDFEKKIGLLEKLEKTELIIKEIDNSNEYTKNICELKSLWKI